MPKDDRSMNMNEEDIDRISRAVVTLLRNEQCLKCGRIGSRYRSLCDTCSHERFAEPIFVPPIDG